MSCEVAWQEAPTSDIEGLGAGPPLCAARAHGLARVHDRVRRLRLCDNRAVIECARLFPGFSARCFFAPVLRRARARAVLTLLCDHPHNMAHGSGPLLCFYRLRALLGHWRPRKAIPAAGRVLKDMVVLPIPSRVGDDACALPHISSGLRGLPSRFTFAQYRAGYRRALLCLLIRILGPSRAAYSPLGLTAANPACPALGFLVPLYGGVLVVCMRRGVFRPLGDCAGGSALRRLEHARQKRDLLPRRHKPGDHRSVFPSSLRTVLGNRRSQGDVARRAYVGTRLNHRSRMLSHEKKLLRSCRANRGLVLSLLIISAIVVRYNQTGFALSLPARSRPSPIDFLIFDMGTDGQLSIAWLLAPLCSMALVSLALGPEAHEMALLGHGSLRRLWLSELIDAILAAAHVSVAVFLISLFCGFAAADAHSAGATSSVFAMMTGQEMNPSASQVFVALACLAHLLSVTFFVTLIYLGTRRITGSRLGSFALTLALLLPSVTDGNSFVSDLLRNLPGIAFVENPIHAFVTFQSVDWQRWLGGEAPHLWFLPLMSLLLAAVVYGLSNRQEVPWR